MEHLIGRKVENDIINSFGITIVPAETILNHEAIRLLNNHRIDVNSIILATKESNKNNNDNVQLSNSFQQTVSKSKELFESISIFRKVPLMEIRKEILPNIHDMTKHQDIFELFEAIKAKDDYTYQHNIGVGILSTLIGTWMNLDESELSILSLAATLHDVGKVHIPIEILNKPGKLTDKEFNIVKKHTILGYDLLKATTGLNTKVARVALQHHEREDGRGYPLGLKKTNIELFSSIVAVADVFHAMSSKRPYHEPIPFHEIVSQMGHGRFGELNPQIVSLFLENMMKRTVGKQVVLTDGRLGKVVMLNPHRIETPLIKIDDVFVDLSQEEGLRISSIVA
ncbi:MAG: HD-GYP domain-containing protein [Candidatus Pristimantibacillus lignocellulolyticus]|uniref:HD-GYP domain-containing protein n=1 Tax=Candidatus Pristimantibacillus lignocellulolyticus TaxID=2994561 RepID=A0A9J6Z9I4_9BACL|nr:MAG: HD-GYP domain-containing protein [Candidatus Pristimantibacillus lignocellulolyticus]